MGQFWTLLRSDLAEIFWKHLLMPNKAFWQKKFQKKFFLIKKISWGKFGHPYLLLKIIKFFKKPNVLFTSAESQNTFLIIFIFIFQ